MFDMPQGDSDTKAEGTSDEHPIAIPGVDASEFRNLLKLFYCLCVLIYLLDRYFPHRLTLLV
jgi:hypothetical protein